MATEHAEEPVLAQEASPTTTLALVPEGKLSMPIPLERQRIVLQGWIDRQMLHDPSTKAFKELGERVAKLQQKYDKDLSVHRGRQLMQPALREAAMKKRTATLEKKRAATIDRVVASVEGVAPVKDKAQLKAAVAAALAPPQEPPPKKHKKGAKAAVEEEDDDE